MFSALDFQKKMGCTKGFDCFRCPSAEILVIHKGVTPGPTLLPSSHIAYNYKRIQPGETFKILGGWHPWLRR